MEEKKQDDMTIDIGSKIKAMDQWNDFFSGIEVSHEICEAAKKKKEDYKALYGKKENPMAFGDFVKDEERHPPDNFLFINHNKDNNKTRYKI